jgi:hypothetical protein
VQLSEAIAVTVQHYRAHDSDEILRQPYRSRSDGFRITPIDNIFTFATEQIALNLEAILPNHLGGRNIVMQQIPQRGSETLDIVGTIETYGVDHRRIVPDHD